VFISRLSFPTRIGKKRRGRTESWQSTKAALHREAEQSYFSRKSTNVAAHLSKAYADELKRQQDEKQQNRAVLAIIVDIVRFLARQNISFRGHRESDSDNSGNFLQLVHFTAKYEPKLNSWLDSHPQNVSWLSHDIQNELLHLLAVEVLSQITDECRRQLFSIMCDEVSDRSNHELLSIVVRYVLPSGSVKESLTALLKVDSTNAAYLSDIIVKTMLSLNLSLESIIGQCYDGASNMAGQYSGVQARLKQLCVREPLFVHCWAHNLNLVLQDTVKNVLVCRQIFDLLNKLYVVIEGSPKRHGEYLSYVSELCLDDGQRILQSLCSTRWSARSTNLRVVLKCLPAVIKYLESQYDSDSVGLLKTIKNIEFIFGITFLNELFLLAGSAIKVLVAIHYSVLDARNGYIRNVVV